MDQQSAEHPKPQDPVDSVPLGNNEQSLFDAAYLEARAALAGCSFDRLLAAIGGAMGDDWPEWVKKDLDPAP